jgi:alkaline phosphatase
MKFIEWLYDQDYEAVALHKTLFMKGIQASALFLLAISSLSCNIQVNEYQNDDFYEVKAYAVPGADSLKPKNIILLIGDGMGLAQIYAGQMANRGKIYLNTMPVTGQSKTNSSDELITDSAAGATAFSAGVKTYNGAIGVDAEGNPVKTILEEAEEKGMSTGLVASCGITHATPASFIAHQEERSMYEEIAADFLNTEIDVFIGGSREHFTDREDGRNLLEELSEKGYEVIRDINNLTNASSDKVAGLIAAEHQPSMPDGRGDMLGTATEFAIDLLDKNETGFFLMVEGSQIDWGGHDNDLAYVVTEMLDFDKVVGEVLDYAAHDGETLVIVTADHETGGLSITGGNIATGFVEGKFSTGGHTGIAVPVYAFGPGAGYFSGSYENTAIHAKMKFLLGL